MGESPGADFQRQLDDLRLLLAERHTAQVKAVDTALAQAERAVDRALMAAEKAVIKAETAADKRFQSVNEFRATLQDQQTTFISRVEALAAIDRNTQRISDLTDRLNRSEGRGAGLSASWAILLGVVGLISTALAIYLAVKGRPSTSTPED